MKKYTSLFTLFFLLFSNSFSQPAGNDQSFNITDLGTGSGFNNNVLAVVIQPDGKIIAGGSFTSFNGTICNRIARLNSDGSLDFSFNPGSGFGGSVNALTLQPDGKILAGGAFTTFNGSTVNYLVRLNSDGSLDAAFNTGFNNTINSLAIQIDGKIIVGGNFTMYSGTTCTRLARINSNGSLDTQFSTANNFSSAVLSIAIQPDGKIVAGGSFTAGIKRVTTTGAVDGTFSVGTGFNSTVRSVVIQPDGKVIAGGDFTSYSGSNNVNRFARLTSTGALDYSGSFNSSVYSVILQPDGKIIAGGNFTTYSSSTPSRIVRLNSNGSVDATLITGTGFNSTVATLALQPDGKIITGGDFTTFDGRTHNRIARMNMDQGFDLDLVSFAGLNNEVYATVVQPDGKVIVGGSFSGAGQNRIIRLNEDGSKDENFETGTGFNNIVYSLLLQPDGKIIAAGNFTSYNGSAATRIARLNADGSLDGSFITGSGFDNGVRTLAIQSDGKIIAGGLFTAYNGTPKNRIVRLTTTGAVDATFSIGNGFNSTIYSLAVQPDGKIIAGGDFTSYASTTSNRITRINANGMIDAGFTVGSGFNQYVQAIAIQSDGKIIVGGNFTSYNGTNGINRIIRLNADGTNDSNFNSGTGLNSYPSVLTIQPDGKIIVGGGFSAYNGTTTNRIVRLNIDASIDNTLNVGAGFNSPVYALSIQQDGKIIAGGNFTTINNVRRYYLTRLFDTGLLDLSFNFGNGIDDNVTSLVIQPDGKILVAGNFYGGILRLDNNGTIDANFNPGSGSGSSDVNSITLQPDGKIIVVGSFTTFNGIAANRIVRLNSDGSTDGSFITGSGFNQYVNCAYLQPDGKIIAGGNFTAYDGTTGVNRIVRLNSDGTLDAGFSSGTGFNQYVKMVNCQPDGKIIVGGNFSTYNGISNIKICRLNTDGSLDASFITGTGLSHYPNGSHINSDGTIIVVGLFTTYDGISNRRIVKINPDGTINSNFNSGTGFDGEVTSIVIQPDGRFVLGGSFTSYNGVTRNYVARLDANGDMDLGLNPGAGFNNSVYTLALQSDGKIIVGGSFSLFNEFTRNRIARLNDDSGLYLDFFEENTGFNGSVKIISIQQDDKIVVGGSFTTFNGLTKNSIARLNIDGSDDENFNSGTGFNGDVNAIVVQQDGKIIVGGNFTSYNGTGRNYIARINNDGTLDNTFTFGFNNTVNAIVLQPDGKVVIGGNFTGYIARLNANGTQDPSFNIGTGFSSTVYSLVLQADGKIVVGGNFTSYNGTSRNRIARLNSDASFDGAFSPGSGFNNTVYTLQIQPNGKIFAGGSFTTFNGSSRNYISRLNSDGSIDSGFNPGTGFNSTVYSLAYHQNGKILAGGDFTTFYGTPRNYIARINQDGNLDATFNPGTGFNNYTRAIAYQNDNNKIIVGGLFTAYNGNGRNRLSRLYLDPYIVSYSPDSPICAGINVDVSFESNGTYNAGNIFSVELSDNLGSFSNPVTIGSLSTTISGTISCAIPTFLSTGSLYRIRMSANTPSATGNDNGADIVLSAPSVGGNVFASSTQICYGNTSSLLLSGYTGNIQWQSSSDNVNFSDIIGETNFSYTTLPLLNDTYLRAKVTSGVCPDDFSNSILVNVNPLSVGGNVVSSDNAVCSGNSIILNLTGNTGNIQWQSSTDNVNFSNINGANSSVYITNPINSTTYYRAEVVSGICPAQNSTTIQALVNPTPVTEICLVTVDVLSSHNIIYWEKPVTALIDSFFVYKEITTNNYLKIASIAYDSLNEYHDFASNPNTTSYKYKVSVLDTCGFESEKSNFHNTIHLQNLGDGNLQWTVYNIENAGNPVNYYRVYRDDFGTNNFQPIDANIPGGNSTYTDANYSSYPSAHYLVDVDWNISCTPFRSTISTSRSNLWPPPLPVGIENNHFIEIKIYPNPASENLTIEIPETSKLSSVELMNSLGQVVYRTNEFSKNKNVTKHQIDVENFVEGVYTFFIQFDSETIVRKIVIH